MYLENEFWFLQSSRIISLLIQTSIVVTVAKMEGETSDLVSKSTLESSYSRPPSIFVVDAIGGDQLRNEECPPQISLKSTSLIDRWNSDMSNLGFKNHEKVDGTPNPTLPLIITTTIDNHYVLGILVDDESSCNLIFLVIFMKLGLSKKDLKSCEG